MSNRSITGYHLSTFTIRISRRFSSAREFQMGNFQKYWSQNVGEDFIVLDFLLGGYRAGGEGVRGKLMSPAHETQSMREIRLLRGRLLRKGGGLTGMTVDNNIFDFFSNRKIGIFYSYKWLCYITVKHQEFLYIWW